MLLLIGWISFGCTMIGAQTSRCLLAFAWSARTMLSLVGPWGDAGHDLFRGRVVASHSDLGWSASPSW